MKQQEHAGIVERTDRTGRTRWQVRVRRNGRNQVATLGSLEEALSWRAAALAAAEGRGQAPQAPRPIATAPELLAAGLGSHAVAALLGHADASLVDRRYGHALPDELATAGDRLSAWRQSRM